MSEPTPEQQLLAGIALQVFELNGQVLDLAESLAEPAGLTAAWWQVLGAVLGEPLPVSGIARRMGMARQSVQRVADLLVDRGLAAYRDNPAHRRAKLLTPTQAGRDAVQLIDPGHRRAAVELVGVLGPARAQAIRDALEELSGALAQMAERRVDGGGSG